MDALKERLTRPTLGYENPVTPDYLETIVRWMEERHGYKIGAEEIITCTGAIDALKIAILAFTKPGDGILIQQPVYGPFSAAIQTSGRKVVNNRLLYESGVYQIDFDDLEEKASDPHTTMLAFCNPHNPVGRVWSVEELHRIYDICRRHDVYIVSDEVHGDIVRAACTYTPMGRIGTEKVIMTTTPGKAFNVSGLHLAHVLIGSPVTREAFVRERGRSFPSPFAAAAAKAAYSEGGTWPVSYTHLDVYKRQLYWPGHVPGGTVCHHILSSLDFLPTFASLCKTKPREGIAIDGIDFSPLLTGKTETASRNTFFYYFMNDLEAVREGKWKLHVRKNGEQVQLLYCLLYTSRCV